MIRITELPLPMDPDAREVGREVLRAAIVQRLGIDDTALLDFSVYKRSYDARRKSSLITFVYIIDAEVSDEAQVLRRLADDRHVMAAPDTRYQPPARARDELRERPIVIGFGPGGLFAALILAQQGYRPIVLERGKPIVVQVERDPEGQKGAILTTNLSFAGRYLVLTPFDSTRGVSRKVEDEETRAGLRAKCGGGGKKRRGGNEAAARDIV